MKIYVDLDETLAIYDKNKEREYENALPHIVNINKINKLYDKGHEIYVWTARGTVTKINHYNLTKTQLNRWNVKYTDLIMGKPSYDIYIDDKSINSIYDWNDDVVDNILSNKQYEYLNDDKITQLLLKQKQQINNFFTNINKNEFEKIVNLINDNKNVYFLGIGKSGNIAKHTADTLKSININATYLDAVNLSHGDIGGVVEKALVIIFSNSGNTEELLLPIYLLKQKQCYIILVSSNNNNKLSKKCDYNFIIPATDELDDLNKIPTSSIIFYTIFTNILTSLLIYKNEINIDKYKYNHISGNTGYKLFTKIKDVYKKKEDLQCHIYNNDDITCADIIFKITGGKIGLCIILNSDDTIYGIITDGTIRLYMLKYNLYNLNKIKIKDIINTKCCVIDDYETSINNYVDTKYKYIPVLHKNVYIGVYKTEKF